MLPAPNERLAREGRVVLLLFDGDCAICRRLAEWVRARDRFERVLVLSNRTPGLVEECGITREDADREAWAVDAYGQRWSGAAAINRVLADLPGLWPRMAPLYWLRPIGWCEDRAYRWVAQHRGRLHGRARA